MVCFNNILVNLVNTNAGIFVGTNSQGNWRSGSNSKVGFGSVMGSGNVVSRAVNIFLDNDVIDTPIITGSGTGAELPPPRDNIAIYGCGRARRKEK